MNGELTAQPDSCVGLVPYEQDPLQVLAEKLLDKAGPGFDLSAHIVVLPHPGAHSRLRQVLANAAAQRGLQAVLPPYAGTLDAWLKHISATTTQTQTVIKPTTRELLLYEALKEYPQLCERYGTWPLIDNLLRLFDELFLNRELVKLSAEEFHQCLAQAYGVRDSELSPLSQEARLAYTLWQAWREQLRSHDVLDPGEWRAQALADSLQYLTPSSHVFIVGLVNFTRLELAWLKALEQRQRLTLLLHGQTAAQGYHPDTLISELCRELGYTAEHAQNKSTYAQALDRVYQQQGQMLQRAQTLAQQYPQSPLSHQLTVQAARDAEHEARVIDVQIRRWYLQGLRNIGIVTNDRKLARRIRALLERANINLLDSAGWALSTTSAATALMRWIECLEQDFASTPLFDLLKSPFVELQNTADQTAVNFLEQHIVRRYQLLRGLENYNDALQHASIAGQQLDVSLLEASKRLLQQLQQAATSFSALRQRHTQAATDWLDALTQGLESLGITQHYAADSAGQQLLQLLKEMRSAALSRAVRMSWREFRSWLGRSLEQRKFRPPMSGRDVELMGMLESRLYRFDALVIAGASQDHLPGAVDDSAFFNESVRAQLELPGNKDKRNQAFYDFRRLLEAAPRVMISWRQQQDGEAVLPSPWVERLQAFHQLAYNSTLEDKELDRLAKARATQIVHDHSPLPQPMHMPCVQVDAALLPQDVTASSYQSLLDCPYQFYARHCLGLKQAEDILETMQKADYGQHVHKILQAFHQDLPGLPGPHHGALTAENRTEAIELLQHISKAVFVQDVRKNFLARAWLLRWHNIIPAYIDWQIKQSQNWTPVALEKTLERHLRVQDQQLSLHGRIDRIDQSPQGVAIIDYKTGTTPDQAAVLSGESIQLPFYALLSEPKVETGFYLSLQTPLKAKVMLDAATLIPLSEAVQTRLFTLQQQMQASSRLPAWGNVNTCAVCDMQGLCRRELWQLQSRKKKTATSLPPCMD